jgi:hypothetical protein
MIKKYHDDSAKKTKVLWEKEERDKHAALFAGVCFFMVLILFLWLLNTKSFFDSLKFNKKKQFNIDKFSQEFNQSFSEVMTRMGNMGEMNAAPASNSPQAPAGGGIDSAKKE